MIYFIIAIAFLLPIVICLIMISDKPNDIYPYQWTKRYIEDEHLDPSSFAFLQGNINLTTFLLDLYWRVEHNRKILHLDMQTLAERSDEGKFFKKYLQNSNNIPVEVFLKNMVKDYFGDNEFVPVKLGC